MSQLCPLPGVQYYFLNRCFNFFNLSTAIPRWFHKTLQGMCFLSDKYNLSERLTWRYMPCGGCNLPMCRKEWEGMRYTISSAMPCGLNNPFLRLWGFVCRHGLWVGQGVRAVSGGYVVVLVWGVEFGGLMGCDPELDVLLHIPSFVLVAVLVRCTELCLSSVLIAVTWQSFPLLVLPWPLGLCFLFFSL